MMQIIATYVSNVQLLQAISDLDNYRTCNSVELLSASRRSH